MYISFIVDSPTWIKWIHIRRG